MIERELIESIEPSDDQRGAARSLYGLFIALIDEGFDEAQALHMITALIGSTLTDS